LLSARTFALPLVRLERIRGSGRRAPTTPPRSSKIPSGVLRQPRAPPVQQPSGQTTAQHGNCDGAHRQAVERNCHPGHKRGDDDPYTRAGQQTGRADRDDAGIEPASTRPRTKKTRRAGPLLPLDRKERSGRLKPGTRVSANAAVTRTQTSLKTISIPKIPEIDY
jgi:hypothetical protein